VPADAEHSAFGDRPLPGDQKPRNPNHHRAILALSTAFWDAYLRGDAAARAWLQGARPPGSSKSAIAGRSNRIGPLNYLRTGYFSEGLLDVHLVTDDEIARRTSSAAKIGR